MQPSRIHHVGLPVSDLDLSVAWYREALGLTHESSAGVPGGVAFMVAPTGERLELLAVDVQPSAWDDPIAALRAGIPHTAWTVDDLDAAHARVVEAGGRSVWTPRDTPEPGLRIDFERLASGAGRNLLEELDDSKRVARAKRERLAQAVLAHAEAVSLVSIPASQIDRIGIDPANVACLERALRALGQRAELRLVDGRLALGAGAPVHERIVRGDATSATIAAASIVAKVARDRLMARLGERYPGYGFERHVGYGTKEHMVAVAKLGPTPEHRLSFNARCFAEALDAAPTRRRKPRRASWRELPAAEMAAHLLETPTIGDRVWTDEPRLPRETRTAVSPSGASTGSVSATE